MNEAAVFVVTHDPPEEAAPRSRSRRASTTRSRQAAKPPARRTLWSPAARSRQALDSSLVDEIQLHVAPILLGAGVRLFDTLRSGPMPLETIDLAGGELIDLRFRVAKPAAMRRPA